MQNTAKKSLPSVKSEAISILFDIHHISPKLVEELQALETCIKESLKLPVLNNCLMYSKFGLLPNSDARWKKQGIYVFIACGNLEEIVYIGSTEDFEKRLRPRHCRQTLAHNIFRHAKEIDDDIIVYTFEVTYNYKNIELGIINAFSPVLNTNGKLKSKTFEVLQYILSNPGCTQQAIVSATQIGDRKRKIIIDELIESGKIHTIQGISKVGRPAYYHYPNGHG